MADVSGILAAGDIGADAAKAAQQPLQNMSTMQSILNAQEQNKLYQLDQQQKQLDLDKGQTSYISGRLATAAYLPIEQQTPELYHHLMDDAAAMGPQVGAGAAAFQQKVQYWRNVIDNATPEERKAIAFRAGMAMAPPDVQQRMASPDLFSVNQGNQMQFFNRPKAGMPGENVPAPVGSAVPIHMTESEGANLVEVKRKDGGSDYYFKRQMAPDGTPNPGEQPVNSGGPPPEYGGRTNHSGAGLTPELQTLYQAAADKYHVPVELLIAQGRQETTGFNTKAVGSAGEIGLGQIKPSTAQSPGMGVTPVDPSKLTDPATNINFQAEYLVGLANKLHVDINTPAGQAAVLRAYNGGGDPQYVAHVFQYMPKGGGAGGGTGSATAATTGKPAPNQTASVKPMVPVQPATAPDQPQPPPQPTQTADASGVSGIRGAPVTSTSPLTATQLEADQKQYHTTMAEAPQVRQNIADYTEAYNLVKGLSSGKGLEYINNKRSLIASWARRFNIDAGDINTEDKAYDLATKILTRIQMQTPGAGQSVFALDTAGHASPNLGSMNHDAALEAIRQNVGTLRQKLASGMEHDPAQMGRGFQKQQNDYMAETNRDGFAADFMTKDEVKARLAQLGGKDSTRGKAFLNAIGHLQHHYKLNIGDSLD